MNSKLISRCLTRRVATALGGLLLVGACTGSALAQVRPPVRPATPVTRPTSAATAPATRSATARPSPAPTHGNSVRSNKPTHVYGIFETKRSTGETRLHKVGISGTEPKLSVQRHVSPRAENQVRALNNTNSADSVFRTRVLEKIPAQPGGPSARQQALWSERRIVTNHAAQRGASPTGNTLPKPAPFSPVPRTK